MAYPAENAFHRIPQWWKVENLLVNVSWFDAAFTGDIDFAEAIENVDSVDGPNLVNNLGSPLFQYSYWFGCDCFTFPRHPATPPEKVWYEILHTHTHQNISKLPQHTPNISECTGISNVAVYWFYILYTSSHRLMSFGIQMDQQKSYKVVPKSSYRWHINGVI